MWYHQYLTGHCPSGDDPFTSRIETHCNGKNQLNPKGMYLLKKD